VPAHDETPTSELPRIVDKPTQALPPIQRHARLPWYRKRPRGTFAALAGVAALAVAGIAMATAAPAGSGPAQATSLSLPAGTPPSRNAAPRANRATRPTPTATPTAKPAPPSWVAPMAKFHVNSCYGMRRGAPHQGIDIADVPGAKILAAHAGTVVAAGWNSGGYGNMVIIKHSAHLFTLYGHSRKVLVHIGQKVTAGQPIALEGSTGHVTGPHLHFEVWTAMWKRIDPGPFLKKHGIILARCQ
jgi:murein DD-endopeptidase MepM/ murein hydrolase activator NlpD